MNKKNYKSFDVRYHYRKIVHIEEFSVLRIGSILVNLSLEHVKFDISTCAFKRGIRVAQARRRLMPLKTVFNPTLDGLLRGKTG